MRYLTIAALIFASYAILAVNTVAIARGYYFRAAGSATLFMLANFYLIQHVAEARTTRELAAYVLGGVSGDLVGIWLSRRLER